MIWGAAPAPQMGETEAGIAQAACPGVASLLLNPGVFRGSRDVCTTTCSMLLRVTPRPGSKEPGPASERLEAEMASEGLWWPWRDPRDFFPLRAPGSIPPPQHGHHVSPPCPLELAPEMISEPLATHAFIHSLAHLFIHLSSHSLIPSSSQALICSFIHSLIHPLTHSSTHSLTYSSTNLSTHLFIHLLFTHSFTPTPTRHSLTHSSTCSFTHFLTPSSS